MSTPLPPPPSSAGLLGPTTEFLLADGTLFTPSDVVDQLRRGVKRSTLATPELGLPRGVFASCWRAPVQVVPVKLTLTDGASLWELMVSPNQPFATTSIWVPASALRRGASLVTATGSLTVVSVTQSQSPHSLYDLRVRGTWGVLHPSGLPLAL